MTHTTPEALAVALCNASEQHTSGVGHHDATRYGPCSIHEQAGHEAAAYIAARLAEIDDNLTDGRAVTRGAETWREIRARLWRQHPSRDDNEDLAARLAERDHTLTNIRALADEPCENYYDPLNPDAGQDCITAGPQVFAAEACTPCRVRVVLDGQARVCQSTLTDGDARYVCTVTDVPHYPDHAWVLDGQAPTQDAEGAPAAECYGCFWEMRPGPWHTCPVPARDTDEETHQ